VQATRPVLSRPRPPNLLSRLSLPAWPSTEPYLVLTLLAPTPVGGYDPG
jgi:hypothetical protein